MRSDILSTQKEAWEAEERLMLAVLVNAVECFQRYVLAQNHFDKKLFREAEDWIFKTNSHWLFSFENICETLQLDPYYLRWVLLHWKKSSRAARLANTVFLIGGFLLPVGVSEQAGFILGSISFAGFLL
jgi:hypothetical protein